MRTLAITGAGGFIGRRLVAEALARGWAVRALMRHPSSQPEAACLETCRWDAGDPPAATARLLAGADVACHLAAFIPGDTADPALAEPCFRINALGTLTVLEAAAAAGVRRLVHFSTGNAYAPGPGPAAEDAPLYPSARAPYYLASKLAGEVLVDHWGREHRLATCILRVASVYGPGMSGGLVRHLALRLRARRDVTVLDGGRYGTDLVLVDDVVAAALAAAQGDITGPVNVGSGVRTTTGELARLLVDLAGADPAQLIVDPVARQPHDSGFRALDITRARDRLGYAPTRLYDGLARYCASLPPSGSS